MADLDLNNIVAYNVVLKESEAMKVDAIIRTPIMKEGVPTGKYRYRFAGKGSNGTGMSRFTKKETAEAAAEYLGLEIEDREAKSSGKRMTCKAIGVAAEEKCVARKAAAKEKRESKKAPAKKATAAKKAPAKKAKAPAKKRGRPVKASE